MNVSYEKLRVLMVQKGLSKKDICFEAKISTRTMAKITKNESVNIDALKKICNVLNCDISDIVSLTKEPITNSLYDSFVKDGVKLSKTEYVDCYGVSYNGVKYLIYKTKRKANAGSHIELVNNDIMWRQISRQSRLTGTGIYGSVEYIARIRPDKKHIIIFVISGKPGEISGLDEGIFRSTRNFGGVDYVNIMSEPIFKSLKVNNE